MRRVSLLSLLVALATAGAASAKEFRALVIVGADGDSIELSRPRDLADSLFDGANRLNRRHSFGAAAARGSYVRLYPLGAGGDVGVPGRFYPATGAVCLSWDQGTQAKPCQRPNPTLLRALQVSARRLARFRGRSVALVRLENPIVNARVNDQLRVAVELALDRYRRAVRAARPARCIEFGATWRGVRGWRPRRLCLARGGVYAAGQLYPLGPAPWDLARINMR